MSLSKKHRAVLRQIDEQDGTIYFGTLVGPAIYTLPATPEAYEAQKIVIAKIIYEEERTLCSGEMAKLILTALGIKRPPAARATRRDGAKE